MMAMKINLFFFLLLWTLFTGVFAWKLREISVKTGEMVALQCPYHQGYNGQDSKLIWTKYGNKEMDLTDSLTSLEQRGMDLLLHGRSLVILRAAVNHQGNYSCSLGGASRRFWSRLTVYATQKGGNEERFTFPQKCDADKSCSLSCPDVNTPAGNTFGTTSNGVAWRKEDDSSSHPGYFWSVEEKDRGVYTCTRSYLYQGQTYNMTFRVVLDVQPKKNPQKTSAITSPRMNDVYKLELGSEVVIDCRAILYSEFEELFWLSGETFVDTDDSLPVFYNYTLEPYSEGVKMTASLVFKKVSENELSKPYSCKLESSSQASSFVTIMLTRKGAFPCNQEVHVKEGEMVALDCPHPRGYRHNQSELICTSSTGREMDLTNSMSSAEQRPMDLLLDGRSLVILRASVNHQGNYSCSQRHSPENASVQFWFWLAVHSTQFGEYDNKCDTQESCTLICPALNTPVNKTNITSAGLTWHKEGDSSSHSGYFSSVEEKDQGVYTCTRSYLYQGQTYNMTFRVVLDVQPKKALGKSSAITFPRENDVFHVDLGSTAVIDCKADLYSDSDEVFWLIGEEFADTNDSLPVFYNTTIESNVEGTKMTASLVFQKVSEEDVSRNLTCKLDSENQPSTSVTVTLELKPPPPSHVSLALTISIFLMMMVLTVALYVKFKISITLFLRDDLGCHGNSSDGRSFDAFLVCYKSDTDPRLNEGDRKWLTSVLEERFGYSLCLYDRDVILGKAVADAVLDCIKDSRSVVLVPSSSDSCPGSGLLSVIHAALVDRQTRLVFIRSEAKEAWSSGSLPETLQLLAETGECVTWKGISSVSPSSSFLKELRYYLTAPQHAREIRLQP